MQKLSVVQHFLPGSYQQFHLLQYVNLPVYSSWINSYNKSIFIETESAALKIKLGEKKSNGTDDFIYTYIYYLICILNKNKGISIRTTRLNLMIFAIITDFTKKKTNKQDASLSCTSSFTDHSTVRSIKLTCHNIQL